MQTSVTAFLRGKIFPWSACSIWAGLTSMLFMLSPAPAQSTKIDEAGIVREFRATILPAMKSGRVPGLAIALVDAEHTMWAEGFGLADEVKKTPATAETPFAICSVSKTVTTTAVLMAVRDGLLNLDKPITTYIPWFTVHSRLEEHPESRITLRHLLSHTSGLTSDAPIGNSYDPSRETFEAHIRSIAGSWLRFRVGERFSYSNMGMDLAGYILQVASGKPFAQYIQDKLLDPLGMAGSSYDFRRIQRYSPRATGYSDGLEFPLTPIPVIPAGGLYASVSDLANFVRFHLNGGKTGNQILLSDALLKSMYAIPFPVAGQTGGYALGIDHRESRGSFVLSHSGRGYGFQSYMLWYPEYRIGAVVLANCMNGNLPVQLGQQLLKRILDARGMQADNPPPPSAIESRSITPDLSILRTMLGSYINERAGEKKVVLKGNLLGFQSGEEFNPLSFYAEREAVAIEYGWPTSYRFLPSRQGAPACLVRIWDGVFFDYNHGPEDGAGPDKPEWKKYCGTYRILMQGKPIESKTIHLENGYLYIDRLRAMEYQPGLFFESTGEALDFRTSPPTWGNIKLSPGPERTMTRSGAEQRGN